MKEYITVVFELPEDRETTKGFYDDFRSGKPIHNMLPRSVMSGNWSDAEDIVFDLISLDPFVIDNKAVIDLINRANDFVKNSIF